MVRPKIALLGYALIGMLHQKPASGYDLRKIFKETPMAGYSDSPGAIYPALRRLEEMGLIKGIIEAGSGLRRRKVLRLTSGGVAALKKWLTKPIERADVVRGINELMLRFAFLDGAMGSAATLRFLQSFESELKIYIPTLKNFFIDHSPKMPDSGRLALQCGILGYEAQLQWASHAITVYRKKEKMK